VIFSKRGFTLIEVMVALTLLGLITTLLASGTGLGLDIAGRGSARAEAVRMARIERDVFRSQLQGALPFHYRTQDGDNRIDHIAFEGESDHIRFVSRDGILDGPDGLPRWVELRPEKAPDTQTKLVVEERRIQSPDNLPAETSTARAEMRSCSDLRFEYLDTTGEKPQWLPAWTGTDRKAPLPFAIRLQCKTARDAVRWLIPLDYAESAQQGMVLQ
jgi:general secretion pathway protein J